MEDDIDRDITMAEKNIDRDSLIKNYNNRNVFFLFFLAKMILTERVRTKYYT